MCITNLSKTAIELFALFCGSCAPPSPPSPTKPNVVALGEFMCSGCLQQITKLSRAFELLVVLNQKWNPIKLKIFKPTEISDFGRFFT
jgi:hypothetical protein